MILEVSGVQLKSKTGQVGPKFHPRGRQQEMDRYFCLIFVFFCDPSVHMISKYGKAPTNLTSFFVKNVKSKVVEKYRVIMLNAKKHSEHAITGEILNP